MVNLRLPNIKGSTERERLEATQSYLYQLVEQLQFALNTIESTTANSAPIEQPIALSRVVTNVPAVMSLSEEQATFQAIKPYIIKSADIVNAYYETISKRLENVYVAQSDFGTFAEKTSQEINETATDTTQKFNNLQAVIANTDVKVSVLDTDLQDTKVGIGSTIDQISDEVGVIDSDLQGVKAGVESGIKDLSNEVGKVDSKIEDAKNAIGSDIDKLKDSLKTLNEIVIEVNANIKSGLIDHDDNGIPIYGLEIGQKNTVNGVEVFNKFARFSAGRLSFYDNNGTEVAYISDYKLYITHAEVTGTLKLGGYLVDTSNGVTFKWVGRS